MTRSTVSLLACVALLFGVAVAPPATGSPPASAADWPYWRGPDGDGTADVAGLPESWSTDGDNLAWTAPLGGRSAPVVFGDRLYLQNSVGEGPEQRERVVAVNADTGETIWEHRFNVTLSDAPPHRVGWSSPTVDPETGNIYVLGVDGQFLALDPDGELLWERHLSEPFGIISTHGGRTPSPLVAGDLVVVSGVMGGWGSLARGWHRFIAADKSTGEIAWISSPGNPPDDTTYAPPLLVEMGGQRLILDGGGDGGAHALQASTGVPVWDFPMSKRGINTGLVVAGDRVIVSHGEENNEDSTMGMVAAIDPSAGGTLGQDAILWRNLGLLMSYSSPVFDGELYYQIDNAANLMALDVDSGEILWTHNLGTIQRASPVLADGKLYVGTANGTFWILRPSRAGVEVLDREELTHGDTFEEIIASAAVARGRVYVVSSQRLYAIGPDEPTLDAGGGQPQMENDIVPGPPATVQIRPQELILEPGETVSYEARLYDADGHLAGVEQTGVTWSVDGPVGEIAADGTFVAGETAPAAGTVTAAVDGIEGSARLRVFPPLPWSQDFDGLEGVPPYWVGALGKFRPETVDGNGVLVKTNDNPFLKRTKVFLGPSDLSDYTVQVDFRSDLERRRLGDAGLIAQRHALILFGTRQRLELQPWQPETRRTISVPFSARPDVWYRMKLRTTNQADGTVQVQGKLWERDADEPAEWTIDTVSDLGESRGSPGLYADAHAILIFDNLTVEPVQ